MRVAQKVQDEGETFYEDTQRGVLLHYLRTRTTPTGYLFYVYDRIHGPNAPVGKHDHSRSFGQVHDAAVTLGRAGGLASSASKSAAARANGLLGGRPRLS